jgi:HK97 family phage major capsid protein
MDLRQVITDNALKDIQTEEDGKFIAVCDEIVGPNNGVGASGVQQHFQIPGGITRDNYVDALSKLEDQDLNNGVFLMNRKTAKQFLKWDRSEIGGDLAQDLFKDGLSALSSATIMGVKHIFTIKRNLVPDNFLFCFAEPGFLGRFYTLQEVTLYVEKKKDILRFSARETLGTTIANVAGVVKIDFN